MESGGKVLVNRLIKDPPTDVLLSPHTIFGLSEEEREKRRVKEMFSKSLAKQLPKAFWFMVLIPSKYKYSKTNPLICVSNSKFPRDRKRQ